MIQRLDEGGAQDAGEDRGLRQGERDGGQGEGAEAGCKPLIPAGKSARREEPPVEREGEDEEHGEPEIRQRDADLGRAHHRRVGHAAPSGGGEKAGGEGDDDRQNEGVEGKGQGHRQTLANQLGNRDFIGVGEAEIALQHARDPVQVAHRGGGIQAELVTERGDGFLARVQAQHVGGGIARHDLDHGEDHEARHDETEGERDQASEEIACHVAPS